ncbi:MAG TPA: VWA domain-containing protein [Thermoanaerobaculia bacterium]|nr:VWA domain-containing protein [Thermoanaerobaculia bacterium]
MFPAVPALAGALALVQQIPEHPGAYREEARVERVVVDAYVRGADGEPMPDLTVDDFRVLVDGRRVPLESAEWISADQPESPAAAAATGDSAADSPPRDAPPPGRLLIFFFQTSFEPTRLDGFLRMAIQAHRFVRTMLPTDRIAVVSFDSHLKLRQDFTSDHAKLDRAINEAILAGPPPPPDPESSPVLARYFNFYEAKKAETPERALLLIARAAQPIPGAKSMLFFGWGFGTIGGATGPNATEVRDYYAALRRIAAARISIFTLDVSTADYHTLETSLRLVSDATGGIYEKTHIFPRLAMDRVRRAISGRYQLVFKRPDGPSGFHEVKVELTTRKGEITARTYYED